MGELYLDRMERHPGWEGNLALAEIPCLIPDTRFITSDSIYPVTTEDNNPAFCR